MKHQKYLDRRDFLILAGSSLGGLLTANAVKLEESKIVSLRDAHIGKLEIDLRIMNQYGNQSQSTQSFYTACRAAMIGNDPDNEIVEVCRHFNRSKLGGPMLGNITATSVAVWINLPKPSTVLVRMKPESGIGSLTFKSIDSVRVQSVTCAGLTPDSLYSYEVIGSNDLILGNGRFMTPPKVLSKKPFKIAFGTCYHKVGMYRPELMGSIQSRGNRAMLVLGDSAVDGRKDDYGLINADYLLRDLSKPWQQMSSNVPVSATWDDHDYWGNDTSGAYTKSKKPIDVYGLRKSWKTNWNNPERELIREGIYFSSHIGPVHHIALDTRSCRINDKRGQKNSFLGLTQMSWLREQIESSKSEHILISGGTMWSDYISAGKDSWGTWDPEGREEIFQWIDAKKGSLVVLLSGDRHGARGFAIPRPNGEHIYELEIAGMGGVPGPPAHGLGREHQLFGYPAQTWAFGELEFSKVTNQSQAVFRLINEKGEEIETITLHG